MPSIVDLSTWSAWQICLTPALLSLSLALHALGTAPPPNERSLAHIFPAKTAHARFLPTVAKHIFSYPVLFFGFDLDALESGALDLGSSFAYSPTHAALTSLRPEHYLGKGAQSIRHKLNALMHDRAVPLAHVERVYSVTMPAYLGIAGINPLTVHFGYAVEKDKLELRVVVLEVHNTFGETHVYLLRVGVDEDPKPAKGFSHQWTFPRAFHVSPFNDRTGFYRVSLSSPLHPTTESTAVFPPLEPHLDIRIVFLTPTMEKKIYASLAGTGHALTRRSLVRALARWPFALLLTLPRILYQAARLHYNKKLDVFPRPEPYVRLEGVGDDEVVNAVEGGGLVGALGWQDEGAGDKWARERTVAHLKKKLQRLWDDEGRRVRVVLRAADKAQTVTNIAPTVGEKNGDAKEETLTVDYLSPLIFTDLASCPTAALAYSLGCETERRWRVSSRELFVELLAPPAQRINERHSLSTRFSRHIRASILDFGLSFAPLDSPVPFAPDEPIPPHPLDKPASEGSDWGMARTLLAQLLTLKVGYWAFVLTRARFVRGMETWGEWSRWAEREMGEEKVDKVAISHGSVVSEL